uniref:Uncharacterized protein n=1 Tax=Aegilops tauschii subsp. strangulata TaxID=200361 RepID=A0A452Z0G5_AEGTS
ASYLGLASLERSIARQRARLANLKDGDANTSFYHRQCSYRRQKNTVHSLRKSSWTRETWPRQLTRTLTLCLAPPRPGSALWTSSPSSRLPISTTLMHLLTPRRFGRPSSACPRAKHPAPTASPLTSCAHVGPSSSRTSSTCSSSSTRSGAVVSAALTRRCSRCCPSARTLAVSETTGR